MRKRSYLAALTVLAALLATVSTASAATTWTVTKTADTNDGTCNSDCSLREAVAAATDGDTIVVPASPSPYLITGSAIVFNHSVTVVGGGARSTVLQGSAGHRVIRVTAGTTAMSGVTITGGDLTSSGDGGGIQVQAGTLQLSDSAVVGNKVDVPSGNATGGGLALESGTSATLTRVTVAGNAANSSATSGSSTFGGGVQNTSGTLTIVDSTIAGNSTLNASTTLRARGGGVEQSGSAPAPSTTVDNSTIAGNTSGGAALGLGGNLDAQSGTLTVKNSILANGTTDFGPNCLAEGGTFVSNGGNVKDRPENTSDQCGFGASDRAGADPKLSPLGNFGGPTDTMALLTGSAALDFAAACDVPTDQRGIARPQGSACDSGAYEARTPAAAASADRATAAPGQTVQFDGSASTGDGLSFAWNFGDGATAAGPTAAHAFSATGHHVVVLTVTDLRGATASATVAVDVPDLTKPKVSRLALKPSAFRAAASGGSVKTAAVAKGSKPRTGTRVTFTVSEQAAVRFTVERARPGRRSGKKCVAPNGRGHGSRHCTRYVKVRGAFSLPGSPGGDQFRFTGRIGGKRLGPGRYRLVAVAKDPAGNTGAAKRQAFRIIR